MSVPLGSLATPTHVLVGRGLNSLSVWYHASFIKLKSRS